MADYFNTTHGPVPVSLRGGGAFAFPPKQWSFIEPKDEGTESLIRAVKLGHLVKSQMPHKISPREKGAATATSAPAPAPAVAAPKASSAPASSPAPAPAAPAAQMSLSEKLTAETGDESSGERRRKGK
jgi:hypothetical protein